MNMLVKKSHIAYKNLMFSFSFNYKNYKMFVRDL